MADPDKILMIEDDPVMARAYTRYLKDAGYEAVVADTGDAGLKILRRDLPQVALIDLRLPDMDGFDILKAIEAEQLPVETIIITSEASMSRAIEAMRLGARDYLVKPFSKDRLLTTLANALERQELRRIVEVYRDDIDRKNYFGFIGSSLGMQQVYRTIDSAANSMASVFITGESGTGKEVCAEAIHKASGRAKGPFVAVNCSAIPRDLIESEIFGHVKGAFTGATRDRDGAAKQAHGGTLFLDEICEMELDLQPKLLRFLQTNSFQRVGGSGLEKVDVRIICATNRDPMVEIAENRFREDLYYRVNVLPMHLPPLRDRGGDVLEIANGFLERFAGVEKKRLSGFSVEAASALEAFNWPGNVRQLQNVVHNVVVLNDGDQVELDMLPEPLKSQGPAARARAAGPAPTARMAAAVSFGAEGGSLAEQIRPMADIEREVIERAVELCGGNVPEASYHLGVSTATIYRKKAKWRDE